MKHNLLKLVSIMCVLTFFNAGACSSVYALRTRAFRERETTTFLLQLLSDEGLIGLAQHALSDGWAKKDPSMFADIIQELKRHGFNHCFVVFNEKTRQLVKIQGWHSVQEGDCSSAINYLEGRDDGSEPFDMSFNRHLLRSFIENSMQNVSQHARRDMCLYFYRPEHLTDSNIEGFRACVLDQGSGFKDDRRGEGLPIKIRETLQYGPTRGSYGGEGRGGAGLNLCLRGASFFRIETNDEKEIRNHGGRGITFYDSERVMGHQHPTLRIKGTIIDAVFWNGEPPDSNEEWTRYKADMVSRETERIFGLIALAQHAQLPLATNHLSMNAAQEAI